MALSSDTLDALGADRPVAPDACPDPVPQALRLAVGLYAARGDGAAWRAALKACRDWLGCAGVLDLPAAGQALDPDAMEALAGRVTHCAAYRAGACHGTPCDPLQRARCAALAPHLHEAAEAARNALRASFFDQLACVWILDRSGHVQDSNASAKAIAAAGELLAVIDGALVPAVPGGGERLQRVLAELSEERYFSWPDRHDREATLRLRLLGSGTSIAATLLAEPAPSGQLACMLSKRFKLSARQGELAVHLLAGETLSEAARAMGISRDTANEHLGGLLRRVGAPDRKALFAMLRAASAG
jgi:DNA-binding CsgD family transcriptional regulator